MRIGGGGWATSHEPEGCPTIGRVTDWIALTERTLEQLREVDDRYRPTDFWGPGLNELLTDMRTQGLENFKSWRTAGFWFYPMYGTRLTGAQIEDIIEHAQGLNPAARPEMLRGMLNGAAHARRDFDVARLAWDHARWPIRLRRFGESPVGNPPQLYKMAGQRHGWTHPYLNYMTCMAALSQHVDAPPRAVLELGGGFGVLGEFLLPRSPEMRYVDLDIPPLLTVAAYYLRTLFGDRVATADDLPETGPVTVHQSAVLPNWRIADVQGPFDVFVEHLLLPGDGAARGRALHRPGCGEGRRVRRFAELARRQAQTERRAPRRSRRAGDVELHRGAVRAGGVHTRCAATARPFSTVPASWSSCAAPTGSRRRAERGVGLVRWSAGLPRACDA